MILYRPSDGDVFTAKIHYRPRTCFTITQLGKPIPSEINVLRSELSRLLLKRNIKEIDAESEVTGRDFLMKIWKMIISVPLGIAIINKNMSPQTLSNIFYEIGFLQSYGKETLVIKTKDIPVPSDFIRTEYIEYDKNLDNKLNKFFNSFFKLANYYDTAADQLENNPLLAIDYLKRAYLITGDDIYRKKAKSVFKSAYIKDRAKNSVEMLLANF